MKIIKYSLGILAFAMLLNIGFAYAETFIPSAKKVFIYMDINPREEKDSEIWNKQNNSNQTYKNDNTRTTITNPCPKCVIGVRANKIGGITTSALLVTAGQTKIFEGAGNTGNWYLTLFRSDPTLVTTTTGGTWTLSS